MPKNILYMLIQLVTGIVFGLAGVLIYVSIDTNSSLFEGILYGVLILYAAELFGIWSVGFIHLKNASQLGEMLRAVFLSLVGLLVFSVPLAILGAGVSFWVMTILPGIGAVVGFNFKYLLNGSWIKK